MEWVALVWFDSVVGLRVCVAMRGLSRRECWRLQPSAFASNRIHPPLPDRNQQHQENAYRYNFWGYSTVGYFSPMSRYSYAVR